MFDKVIAIYCLVDDLLKGIGHIDDKRREVADSEIITTALVSAMYFGGHHGHAVAFMRGSGMCPKMLGESRFNRRLHAVAELAYGLFMQVGYMVKEIGCEMQYVLDSFPVQVCDNIRISRSRIVRGEQWRGHQASMRRYFYGVKVQLLVTKSGVPVEFCFVPGREADVKALEQMYLNVPPESEVYADAAYTNYEMEEVLAEKELIWLKAQRRGNSKRPDTVSGNYIKECMRKIVESAISEIRALALRKVHAVTFKGFLIKVMMYVFSIQMKKVFLN